MKKKFLGLFFVATLALTLTSGASGASSEASCLLPPPKYQDCTCVGGYWRCLG